MAPASVPPSILPCQIIKVLPFGAAFSPAASLTLPNPDNLPTGTEVDIWGLDPATGAFRVLGQGSVVSASEITAAGLITEATYLFAAPRAPGAAATDDENAFNKTPTALADGNLSTSITLPSYRSLGVDRALTFVYNSTAADPRPIVAAEVTFPAATGLPPLIEGRLEVGGIEVAGPVFMSTSLRSERDDPDLLPLAAGGKVRQAISFDASQFATGRYPYRYTATGNFGCSKVSATSTGSILIDNQSESAFGAGWTLAGLPRLIEQPDGQLLLLEGDGRVLAFEPPEVSFLPPVGIPLDGPHAMAIDDLDGDGDLDLAVPEGKTGEVSLLFNDGTGDFPVIDSFVAGVPVSPQGFPDTHTVVTGDFNEDGIRDLVVNNQNSNRLRIYLGTGGGAFAPPIDGSPARPQGMDIADMDLDGHEDIVVATSAGTINAHVTRIFFGDGTGNFPRNRSFSVGFGKDNVDAEVGDFTNNGAPDVAVTEPNRNFVRLLLNNGAGGFSGSSVGVGRLTFFVGRSPLAIADFDLDGNLDFAVTNGENNDLDNPALATIRVMFGNGTGAFPTQTSVPTGGGQAASVIAPDINKDGLPDLVAAGRAGLVTVLLNDGAKGFRLAESIPVATRLVGLAAGDLDGDGRLDLVTSSVFDDLLFVLKGDGASFLAPGGDFSQMTRTATGFERRMTDGTLFRFDTEGRLTARVDRNGNETVYDYDTEGRITSISDPADTTRGTTMVYDPSQVSITGPAGRTTFFQLGADGTLVATTNPDGSIKRFVADANKRLIAEVSERGFVTEQNYGPAGRWTGADFPDGASVSAQIAKDLGLANLGIGLSDTNPLPYARPDETVKLEDGKGHPYSITFNSFSSPTEIRDPIGRVTRLERDPVTDQVTAIVRDNDGELPDGTVPDTVRTELEYDELGNVTAQIEAVGTPLQRQTRFRYEPGNDRVALIADASTDPNSEPQCETAGVTCFEYDAKGNLERTTAFVDGAGFESRFSTYDARGLELTRRDARQNTTAFAYDLFGNLEKITNAELNETVFTFDTAGNVLERTEGLVNGVPTPEARTVSFTYDAMNRVETETDGEGATTIRRYDDAGNEIETLDPTDIAITRAYDQRDRLRLEDSPLQGSVSRTYDKNSNLKTVKNALGNEVVLVYDAVNRVEKTTDPLLNGRLFTYDTRDNLKTATDARQVALGSGLSTTFTYDPLGRQIQRTDPLGETWGFDYDPLDNLKLSIDAKGQQIERHYDELSRLITVTTKLTDGTTEDTVAFTYDASGNRLTAADNDSSLVFIYDKLNRLKTAEPLVDTGTIQPPVVLASSYDSVGNRTQLQATEGPVIAGTWSHGYDAAGRLTSLIHPSGDPLNPISLSYDTTGRLARIDFPNGVASQVTYDLLTGRLEDVAHTKGVLDLASFGYTTRPDGLIETILEVAGTRRFTYDGTQQLLTGGIDGTTESYQYDEEGNRTLTHLSTSHTHDDANRLLEDDSFCYTYDSNGNLETKTGKIAGSCLGNPATNYVWDVQNRLVRIDFPDTTFAAYRYDADGRRIEKDVNGVITRYVYDDDNIVLEYDGSNVIAAKYSHGIEVDQPLVMERGGQSYYYQIDHLGSVRKLTNSAGSVANSYDTDSFGGFEIRNESVVNPYTFTAREFDPESGLHFYRARYYDPNAGRFISKDPSCFDANDLNLYRYVHNNAVNFIDPEGLSTISFSEVLVLVSLPVAGAIATAPTLPELKPVVKKVSGSILSALFGFITQRVTQCKLTSATAFDTAVGVSVQCNYDCGIFGTRSFAISFPAGTKISNPKDLCPKIVPVTAFL